MHTPWTPQLYRYSTVRKQGSNLTGGLLLCRWPGSEARRGLNLSGRCFARSVRDSVPAHLASSETRRVISKSLGVCRRDRRPGAQLDPEERVGTVNYQDEQLTVRVSVKCRLAPRVALLALIILLADLSRASHADACLSRQQCIDSHAGYCRHHAGCTHAGRIANVTAPRSKQRPFNADPYGDPLWRDLETNPHGDPVWWETAPMAS
jgi:hypothetical protein